MSQRWLTDTRYYYAQLGQDLLGDWVLTRMWGGRCSRRGGALRSVYPSEEAARRALLQISARRKSHGYRVSGVA